MQTGCRSDSTLAIRHSKLHKRFRSDANSAGSDARKRSRERRKSRDPHLPAVVDDGLEGRGHGGDTDAAADNHHSLVLANVLRDRQTRTSRSGELHRSGGCKCGRGRTPECTPTQHQRAKAERGATQNTRPAGQVNPSTTNLSGRGVRAVDLEQRVAVGTLDLHQIGIRDKHQCKKHAATMLIRVPMNPIQDCRRGGDQIEYLARNLVAVGRLAVVLNVAGVRGACIQIKSTRQTRMA